MIFAVGKKLIVSFSIQKLKKGRKKMQKTNISFVLKDVFLSFFWRKVIA